MNKYELLVIIEGGIVDADVETALEKVAAILTENGATIESTDKWVQGNLLILSTTKMKDTMFFTN